MSFDLFIQRFDSGDRVPADTSIIEESLAPYLTDRDDRFDFVRLRFSDGEADLYGVARLAEGFMVNHASGREVWDVLMALASRADLTIILPGSTVITKEEARAHLPPPLAQDAVVLRSGAEILEWFEVP